MSGGEVGLLDIRSQGVGVREDGEKPIRVGYASGRGRKRKDGYLGRRGIGHPG